MQLNQERIKERHATARVSSTEEWWIENITDGKVMLQGTSPRVKGLKIVVSIKEAEKMRLISYSNDHYEGIKFPSDPSKYK